MLVLLVVLFLGPDGGNARFVQMESMEACAEAVKKLPRKHDGLHIRAVCTTVGDDKDV